MPLELDELVSQKLELLSQAPKAEILLIWERAKQFFDAYKNCEMQLRQLVITAYGNPAIEKGTETFDLANDYKLKLRKSLTYKLTEGEEFDLICSDIPSDIQTQLFRTKTELIPAAYENLTDAQKAVLAPVVTVKPASTQVEIVAPKER